MTIQSSTNREEYNGDGVQTNFPVSFYFLADDHLQVIQVDANNVETVLILNSDYTVNGAGDLAGGSIDVAPAPAVGERIIILRDVPQTQLIDYVENDRFPANSHETGLDKLTMIVQQMQEVLDRTYSETPGGQPSEEFLPSGTRVIIYNDAPPLGWSLVDAGDCVIGISNGTDKLYGGFPGNGMPGDAQYYGENLVRVNLAGTTDGHALTQAELPNVQLATGLAMFDGVGGSTVYGASDTGVRNCVADVVQGAFNSFQSLTQAMGSGQQHDHDFTADQNINFWPRALICMIIERD